MDKFFSLTQFVLVLAIFLCVTGFVVSHAIMGDINSLPGYLVSCGFIYLTWALVRLSWKEYTEERNK